MTLVTLPIGNLADISKRAKDAISGEGYFFCEDTRVFRSLLSHLKIDSSNKQIVSCHGYSTASKITNILDLLDRDELVYLVSDAGSPAISDPAYPIIQEVLKSGHELETYPGVSSPIVALELSGLPAIPFHFHGFLPRDDSKKKDTFNLLCHTYGTHIFFEAPTRVIKTLKLMCLTLKNTNLVVVRELTKKFQSVYRFNSDHFDKNLGDIVPKGEFIILLYVSKEQMIQASSWQTSEKKLEKLALEYMEKGATPKRVSKIIAEILNRSSKEIYSKLVK